MKLNRAVPLRGLNTKEKIKKELSELVDSGNVLLEKFRDKKNKPSVHHDYQSWYTKALNVVQWLAPDRYDEFKGYYEPNPKRKSLGYGTYVIQDYLKSVAPGGYGSDNFDCRGQAAIGVYNQCTIIMSLAQLVDSSLANIETVLYADIQDGEIDSAAALVKVNPRAAGALAGVILEGHLQKVASTHGIKIAKKEPTISDLNEPLKQASIYDIAGWRKISYLADIRNLCTHKKDKDPTADQVVELVDGVRWAIKNII